MLELHSFVEVLFNRNVGQLEFHGINMIVFHTDELHINEPYVQESATHIHCIHKHKVENNHNSHASFHR